jgi:hypothetical protein
MRHSSAVVGNEIDEIESHHTGNIINESSRQSKRAGALNKHFIVEIT